MLQQISAALLTIIQLLLALFGFPAKGTPQPQTDTPCVFVHGLGGWGNYDTVNEVAPYWGMTTGSLLAYLESEGYDCYAASVGPISSAWDRACELYAQLTGTTVDYGAAHSAAHNHDRYGKTYAQPPFPPAGGRRKEFTSLATALAELRCGFSHRSHVKAFRRKSMPPQRMFLPSSVEEWTAGFTA